MSQENKDEYGQQPEDSMKQDDTMLPEDNLNEGNKEENKEGNKKPSFAKKVVSFVSELLLYVVIALVCIFVIPKYVVQRTEVSGPSMEATLQDKDNILVEKVSYRFGKPNRFDIVVFYHFFDEQKTRIRMMKMPMIFM